MAADCSTPRESRVRKEAQRALSEKDSVVDGAKLLEARAKKDDALFRELVGPYLDVACYEAVRGVARDERRVVWTAPNYTEGSNASGARVLEHAVTLLDFRLPAGMPIRDAKREDLLAAAKFYSEQADDMTHKSKWLSAIAALVGRKSVGAVLDANDLAQLQKETEK